MATIFLDTSAWFAALATRQAEHDECRAVYRHALEQRTRLVTTSMVVAEMHTLLRRTHGDIARRFLDVFDDPQHDVVVPDEAMLRAAMSRWIGRYTDQPFSLCDAVSFEVMRSRRIRTAFALDEHFSAAGFVRVP